MSISMDLAHFKQLGTFGTCIEVDTSTELDRSTDHFTLNNEEACTFSSFKHWKRNMYTWKFAQL